MSQLTEETVEHPPEYHGKSITTATKFMHQYREASPVDGGRQGCAIRNASGQVELFTIGTDGTVWNYYPDPKSDTGYSKANTGLKGEAIAAGIDGIGNIYLFAVSSPTLYYVSQISKPGQRWSTPVQANWMQGATPTRLDAVFTRTINGKLYVGVRGISPGVHRWWSVWPDTSGNFWKWAQLYTGDDRNNFFFSNAGISSTHLSFLCGVISSSDLKGIFCWKHASFQNPDWQPRSFSILSQAENPLSVDVATDKSGTDQLFCIFGDGNVYTSVTNIDGSWINWEKQSDKLNLRQAWAINDRNGDIHIICLAENKRLYHLQPTPSGYGTPAEIGGGLSGRVQWVTVARNNDGEIELYMALTGQGTPLYRMGLEQNTGRWQDTQIEVQPDSSANPRSKIKEFISYSTDISVTDDAGAPLVNAPVTVRASDRTTITVGDETTEIDQFTAAHLNLNGAGQLSITQETDSLGVPAIWMHIEGLMPADQVLILEQYGDGHDDAGLPDEMKSIENRFASVTIDDLKNAKDAKGTPLLAHQEYASAMAKAFNQCMKLPDREKSRAGTLHPLLARQGPRTGVHIGSTAEALDHIRVTPRPDLPSWTLKFEDGRASYQTLTHEEAEALIAEVAANSRSAADSDGQSWWSTIGDFCEAIVDGFVEFGQMIVDGVRATFRFVIDGVNYVFNAVVSFVQEAFDMIEAILARAFASIVNFFERAFEWLGFLFNWGDILRTRDALSYTIKQGLEFVPLAIKDIQKLVNSGFGKLDGAVKQAFSELKSQVANSSLGGYAESNRQSDPKFMHSSGNNFVMNGLINNAGAAKVSSVSTAVLDTGPIDIFMAALEQFGGDAEKKNEFSKAQNYMQTVGSKPDNIFKQLLSELIDLTQKFVEAVISGVHDLIQKAFNALAAVVNSIQDFLKAEWDIPFVTTFYRYITTDADHPNGSALTLLDLLSLVIAIPGTTLFKILKGKSPFADKDSVDAFKKSFTSSTMLNNFNGTATNAGNVEIEASSLGDPLSDWKACVACCTAMSELGYWLFSSSLDVWPPYASFPGSEILAKTTLGFECAASFFSFPWFPWSAPFVAPTWGNPAGAANAAWLFDTIVGLLMIDGGSVVFAKKLPENWNDIGVVISLLYASFNCVFVGKACVGASHLDRAVEILPLVPNFTKLGRLTPIVEGTNKISLLVVAGTDALFGIVIAILTAVQGSQDASPRMLPAAQQRSFDSSFNSSNE